MPCSVSSQPKQTSEVNTKSTAAPQKHKFSYIAGIAIRISIGLIGAMLIIPISLYCIMAIFAPKHRSLEEPVIVRTSSGVTTQNSTPTVPTRQEAISWKLAQSYYQQKDYANASAAYKRLSENLIVSDPTQAIWDGYLKLKQALCAYKLKDTVTADIFFHKALQSSSPVTVALANYYLAFIKNEQKLYSDARLRAYKALALLETIDSKFSESLISDCTFHCRQDTYAEALLGRIQQLVSPEDWPRLNCNEPLEQLDEANFQQILCSSTESLASAVMSPRIQKLDPRGGSPRYVVKCSQASLEELFAAFTTGSGQDVRWQCSYENFSSKPVTIYLCFGHPAEIL